MKKGMEMTSAEKFPIGILYQVQRPAFTDELRQISETSLREKPRFNDYEKLYPDFL